MSVIDIDNSKINSDRTLTDPIEYLQKNFKGRDLFRFILTHPDLDHMSGLDELTTKVTLYNFWDTNHNKTIKDDDWKGSPFNKEDWEQYLKLRESEENPKCLRLHRSATSDCCWVEDGIEILSPSAELEKLSKETSEYNHLSYVLRVNYLGFNILLGGDASIEAWEEILNECGEKSLKSNIFFAPHHGSKNNIHENAFKAIAPEHVIISVARGIDYDYDYYSQLATGDVLSTKYFGTMILEVTDSGKSTIYTGKNEK